MELFEQVKANLNQELRNNFNEVLNDSKNSIKYDLESNYEAQNYVTFFAKNCDLELPKKKLSRARLAHPQLEFLFSRQRDLNYFELKERLDKARSETKIGEYCPQPIRTIYYFKDEINTTLNASTRAKWYFEACKKINFWTKQIFSKNLIFYREKYSITLALLPIEFYFKSPDDMFISKLPDFSQLVFVKTSIKPIQRIDPNSFIEEQAEIIKNMPNFFK